MANNAGIQNTIQYVVKNESGVTLDGYTCAEIYDYSDGVFLVRNPSAINLINVLPLGASGLRDGELKIINYGFPDWVKYTVGSTPNIGDMVGINTSGTINLAGTGYIVHAVNTAGGIALLCPFDGARGKLFSADVEESITPLDPIMYTTWIDLGFTGEINPSTLLIWEYKNALALRTKTKTIINVSIVAQVGDAGGSVLIESLPVLISGGSSTVDFRASIAPVFEFIGTTTEANKVRFKLTSDQSNAQFSYGIKGYFLIGG